MKHGHSGTRLYQIWSSMNQRCMDMDNPYYGGRGICVCDEWGDYPTFFEWAKTSGYRRGLSIDRINVDGNYEPDNCQWVTVAEQATNRGPQQRGRPAQLGKLSVNFADTTEFALSRANELFDGNLSMYIRSLIKADMRENGRKAA